MSRHWSARRVGAGSSPVRAILAMAPAGSPSRVRTLAVAGAVLLAAAGSARAAESLWNMEALGRWMYGYDLAARASGGTAVGVIEPYQLSFINPASIAFADLPELDVGLVTQDRWIRTKDTGSSDRRGSTRLSGLRVAIPGPGPLRWGIGYRDLTAGRYQVKFDANRGRADAFQRTLEGRGGLGELSGTLAARLLRNRLAFGVHLGILSGTLEDKVEDDFEDPAFRDSQFLLRTRVENGQSWGVGFLAAPMPGFSVGASAFGKSSLDLKSIWSSSGSPDVQRKASFDLPAGYNLGASFLLGKRNRLAADWNIKTWSRSDLSVRAAAGEPAPDASFNLEDGRRIGVGYTRLPSPQRRPNDPVLSRTEWRLGFSVERLGIRQSSGASVNEWIASGGMGLPIQADRGYVNLLAEFGRTGNLGDVGMRETFLRIGFGVTFGQFRSQF